MFKPGHEEGEETRNLIWRCMDRNSRIRVHNFAIFSTPSFPYVNCPTYYLWHGPILHQCQKQTLMSLSGPVFTSRVFAFERGFKNGCRARCGETEMAMKRCRFIHVLYMFYVQLKNRLPEKQKRVVGSIHKRRPKMITQLLRSPRAFSKARK